jgi:hypothetical protein
MTTQEAELAAFLRVPVVLTLPGSAPMEYERITHVGKSYSDTGIQDYVQLLDKCGRNVVSADPAYVKERGGQNGCCNH